MPDNPLDEDAGRSGAEQRLRDLFDKIEKEEGGPKTPEAPHQPTNDEIRAGELRSPIEGAIDSDNPSHFLSADEVRLRELEQEFEETKSLHDKQAADINDEFGTKMRALEERLQKIKEQREVSQSMELRKTQSESEDARGLGMGLSIAYTFIGMPLLGALLGWGLDNAFHTHFLLGICTIIGVAIGLAYAILVMNRANKR